MLLYWALDHGCNAGDIGWVALEVLLATHQQQGTIDVCEDGSCVDVQELTQPLRWNPLEPDANRRLRGGADLANERPLILDGASYERKDGRAEKPSDALLVREFLLDLSSLSNENLFHGFHERTEEHQTGNFRALNARLGGDETAFAVTEEEELPRSAELRALKDRSPANDVMDEIVVASGVVVAFARPATSLSKRTLAISLSARCRAIVLKISSF